MASKMWGCCDEDKSNGFINCSRCEKTYHFDCLDPQETNGSNSIKEPSTSWSCPSCICVVTKTVKNDSILVTHPKTTKRHGKKISWAAPPVAITTPVHEKEGIQEEAIDIFPKFDQAVNTLVNAQLKPVNEEIYDLKKSMEFMNKDYEEMISKYQETNKKMKELQTQNDTMHLIMKEIIRRFDTELKPVIVEFKDFKKSMEILDKDYEKTKKELQSQNDSMRSITKDLTSRLNAELNPLKNKVCDLFISTESIKEEITKENEETKKVINSILPVIKDFALRINDLEQNSRNNNIEIQCVPENREENVIDIVLHLGNMVGSQISECDIFRCTRVPKINTNNDRPRSIIVQFGSPKLRDEFLNAVINYNKSKPFEDKINSSHLGFAGESTPIFISEHLSPANKALHAAARSKGKEMGYKYIWVRNGQIYMRKDEGAGYKLVKDADSLDKLR